MTPDPFEGQLLLSYMLKDDPGNEREEWVTDLAEARAHLCGTSDMVTWAYLTNAAGETLADTQVLI